MTLPTVLSDDPLLGGPPHVSGHSIRDHLARGFDADQEFYVLEGRPFAGWCDLDLIYDYGCNPPREAHPFMPCWRGQRVTEQEFRQLVRAMHGIESPQ